MKDKNSHPLLFETALNWLSGDRGILHAQHAGASIYVATPEQFGGTGKDWNPEQLLLGAVVSCYMSTFLVFAKKMGVQYNHIECRATGQVELVAGKYQFTKLNVFPTIYIDGNIERTMVDAAIQKTEQYCLVTNSINATIAYHTQVRTQTHAVDNASKENLATGVQ